MKPVPVPPVPVPDDNSEGFWHSVAEGRLAIQRCAVCGEYSHPPTTICGRCHSVPPSLSFEAVSGAGTVVTWTIVRQAFLPGFHADVPYVLVMVELEQQTGLTLVGRLVDGVDAPLRIGAAVDVVFEDRGPGAAVPAFALTGLAT
jgi:uncharacterized OB-fold protein